MPVLAIPVSGKKAAGLRDGLRAAGHAVSDPVKLSRSYVLFAAVVESRVAELREGLLATGYTVTDITSPLRAIGMYLPEAQPERSFAPAPAAQTEEGPGPDAEEAPPVASARRAREKARGIVPSEGWDPSQ